MKTMARVLLKPREMTSTVELLTHICQAVRSVRCDLPLTDSFQNSCNTYLSFLTSDLCQFKELSKVIPQGNSDFIPELHHHYYSYTTPLFSLIFNIFAPEQGTVTTSEVIFSAECLSKGSFSYTPVFSSLYSLVF